VRGKPDSVVIEVLAHYATGAISAPQFGAAPGSPVPSVPRSVPDPRSLFMTLQYALTRLPEKPMAARRPDPRIGHFTSTLQDFGSDTARSPTVRQINRWRLEKKDPAAPMSEPVKPLVYWLDRSIPLQYRETIRAGILEWNKAFEAIGFTNAIEVKVQADDADFDTFDPGLSAVLSPHAAGAPSAPRCCRRARSTGAACCRRALKPPSTPGTNTPTRAAANTPSGPASNSPTAWTCSRRVASSPPKARKRSSSCSNS
jgi:hypothetical protein